jgi:hypothetical protein
LSGSEHGIFTYVWNKEDTNKGQVGHGSIVGQHHEIEARSIIVSRVWGDDSSEIVEVGVGIFDFLPNSLQNVGLHLVCGEVL